MIRRLLSLILLSTLSLTEGDEDPFQSSITVTKLGDNVTLTCKIPRDNVGLSYWYKLNFGNMIETIASGSFDKISLKGPFNNSRFNATKVGDIYSLTITNATKEDEATYLCQGGTAYIMEFFNSMLLVVDDTKTLQKSFTVKQTSDVESVHLGDTMTLQCSLLSENKDDTDQCPDEDKVHWFKGGSESHPGSIYHGSLRNKEDGRCDYSLSKTVTNSSDAGTYYCAVVTCGQILFGEGTEVEIEGFPLVTVLVILLTCSVVVNIALILTRKQKQKPDWKHSRGKVTASNQSPVSQQERSTVDQLNNVEGEEVGVNYAALDFPSRTAKR
ncbi:uncharacterized protein LOC113030076 [Astatotilapia calliptera]|uniref:uncharacterized protein LOC113030076 n=1 Tax=Astatotilapia calliptera TaxID=8154 RepID=UPI000E41F360|nr:uncharacterized protein LOC113030076 [Astatotilapia calliptera]